MCSVYIVKFGFGITDSDAKVWPCFHRVQLLDNILLWGSVLSTPCLKDLALDSTLNRYILSALQTTETAEENIQKCQKVANKLTSPARVRWLAYHCQTGKVKWRIITRDEFFFSRWFGLCQHTGSLGWRASRRCSSWNPCAATSPTWPTHCIAAVWGRLMLSGGPPSKTLCRSDEPAQSKPRFTLPTKVFHFCTFTTKFGSGFN